MKPLDFLIIGAQKCATTTLFEHLREHPRIDLPLEKEVPFFNGEDTSDAAWERFSSSQFGAADGRLRGKVTPQYMCDLNAAQAMHARLPGLKLVAILRDPVERTWSHYRMGLRRQTETRDFDEAVSQLLRAGSLARGRSTPAPAHQQGYESESDFYVTWSEYGRILQHYARLFGRERILVLYTEDLERDPAGTLDRLLRFLGLPEGYRPSGLGKVVHKGGTGNRIPHGLRRWLRQRRALYALWQLVPRERQGRLRFLYEQWNTVDTEPSAPPEQAREALRRHFAADLQLLSRLVDEPPPWLETYLGGA